MLKIQDEDQVLNWGRRKRGQDTLSWVGGGKMLRNLSLFQLART